MNLVSNTGPIIALAKLDRLDLLKATGFQRVCIPRSVYKELLGKVGPESATIDAAVEDFIKVGTISHRIETVEQATLEIDQGERDVIRLGAVIGGDAEILLDDQAGRRAARKLGLAITGTVGLLIAAKRNGAIEQVLPMLEEMRQKGYWLSDALLAQVREMVGE
ncbi:MAG: DUF3368 domain-containing protein [Sedimenticola sp.]